MNATHTLARADNERLPSSATHSITRSALALALVTAVVFTAVLMGPRWFLAVTDPATGSRVEVNLYGASGVGLDEGLYFALIRDAHDGRVPIRDPFIESQQDSNPQTGSFWNVVIGGVGHLVGGDGWSMLLVTTLSAFAAYVLFFLFAFRTTGSIWASIVAMAISMVVLYVVHRSPGFLALRHWSVLEPLLTLDPQREVHIWSRYLAPVMPLPLFFATVLLAPDAILKRRAWALLAAGLLFGLLIYSYLFYWLSLALAVGGWAAWLYLTGERRAALYALGILAIGAAVALPELLLIANNGLTLSDEVQARVGAYGGLGLHREWVSPVLQRLVLGIPLVWLALRGPKINTLYVALYVAPLVPAVTTDWLPQTDHFLFQAWPVFAIPLVVAAGYEAYLLISPTWRRAAVAGVSVIAALAFAHFAVMQARALNEIKDTYAMPADEYSIFRWMEENLSESDTVATPSWITNQQIAAVTPASTYLADGFITRISNDEVAERYLRVSAAFGIDEETVFYRIDPARDVPTSNKLVPDQDLERYYDDAMVYYLFNEGIRRPERLTERFPEWRQLFRRLTADTSVLDEYEADYLYCGHRERFWAAKNPAPGTVVEDAVRQGDAVLYRIVPTGTPGAVEFTGCGN